MNKNKDKHIYISIYLYNKGFVPAGTIIFNDSLGYAGFSYFQSYLDNDYPPLNPSTLNWRDTKQRHFIVNTDLNKHFMDKTFWELIPNENDWGNQILISRFPEYCNMNNAQKLYFLGSRTVGGLHSWVKDSHDEYNIDSVDWLDKIREESIDFYYKDIEKISYIKAITPLTSYGGARPKCMFKDENNDLWIAKFNLPTDPYDMAIAEHCALQISKDIGLNTSESKILKLPSGENVFLSKRFDRCEDNRFHSLSLFSLIPSNSPKNHTNNSNFIQTLIRRYSDFANENSISILLKMLLDIGVNNTDNHLRNLRIILNKNNKWELSPIYDVIFNPFNQNHVYNPANLPLSELYLKNPNLIPALSKELNLDKDLVEKKINKTISVLNNWEGYCNKNGMSEQDISRIGNAVSLGMHRKEYSPKITKTISNKPTLPKLKPKNI